MYIVEDEERLLPSGFSLSHCLASPCPVFVETIGRLCECGWGGLSESVSVVCTCGVCGVDVPLWSGAETVFVSQPLGGWQGPVPGTHRL